MNDQFSFVSIPTADRILIFFHSTAFDECQVLRTRLSFALELKTVFRNDLSQGLSIQVHNSCFDEPERRDMIYDHRQLSSHPRNKIKLQKSSFKFNFKGTFISPINTSFIHSPPKSLFFVKPKPHKPALSRKQRQR